METPRPGGPEAEPNSLTDDACKDSGKEAVSRATKIEEDVLEKFLNLKQPAMAGMKGVKTRRHTNWNKLANAVKEGQLMQPEDIERRSRGPQTLENSAGGISQGESFRESTFDTTKKQACDVPVPSMNIVIMVMGTFGDVSPFIALGKKLAAYGHRVRVASHATYREKVMKEKSIEFYPLGGDPKKFAEWAVTLEGLLLPDTYEKAALVPDQSAMLEEVLVSTWPACTQPDPLGGEPLEEGGERQPGRPFVADAIISNPLPVGHIHCAEALVRSG